MHSFMALLCRLTIGTSRRAQQSNLLGQPGIQALSSRGIRILELFDKSKIEERKQQLKEEAQHGYFDDYKELRVSEGKLFQASDEVISPQQASTLPDIKVVQPDGAHTSLIEDTQGKAVTLLCVAFRNGAEDMLASWSRPFQQAYAHEAVQVIELSLVESVVMSWWPFRDMILKGNSPQAESAGLPVNYRFHFGDCSPFDKALQLSNRLTGYVFLVDSQARVRWRGVGKAAKDEVACLLECSKEL